MKLKKIMVDVNSNQRIKNFNKQVEEINTIVVKNQLKQASQKTIVKLSSVQKAYISISNQIL
jgi:ribosomal protein L23